MIMKKRKYIFRFFTLLELLVSMGVFAVLMLALMQFFTSAQGIWTRSNSRTDMFDSARLAMNMMAVDLQCLYYEDMHPATKKFFHLDGSDSEWKLSFATLRPDNVGSNASSNLVLVFYHYNATTGKLMFKEITDYDADRKSKDWITKEADTSGVLTALRDADVGAWSELAGNIVAFPMPVCQYLKNNDFSMTASLATYPQRIIFSLSLIDSEARGKLEAMGIAFKDIYGKATAASDESAAAILAKQAMQTFALAVSIDR